MDSKTIYAIGDKVQTEDGQIGVVIDADQNPISQNLFDSQIIVVKFPD